MEPKNRLPFALTTSSLALLLLFALAYFYPVNFWGANFHAYLPLLYSFSVVVLAFLPTFPIIERLAAVTHKAPTWIWSLLIAASMWALFYFVYIDTELYGDGLLNLKVLKDGGEWSERYHFSGAFNPNIFTPKNGEQFTFSIVKGLSRATGMSVWAAFRVWAPILGAIFVFVWMEFVQRKLQSLRMRMLGAALGIFAGMTQVFYASPEVYAAPILFFTSYLIALVNFLETKKKGWLFLMVPLLLLSIRSHSSGFALGPTFLYALAVIWAGDKTSRMKWLGWRRAGWMIPLGFMLIAIVGYFTAFKGGDDSVKVVLSAGNMFLTILGGSDVDDAYYMLAPWHFWDYLQEILYCSAPTMAVLLGSLMAPQRRQRWSGTPIIGVWIGLFLLAALYFVIDPHVTMPRDWDLFSLFTPPLLVLALVQLSRNQTALENSWLAQGLVFALIGLQFAFVWVNHDKMQVHERQLDVAKHVFISDEAGGTFIVKHTLDAMEITPRERLARLDQQLQILAPYENRITNADFAYLYQYGGIISFELEDYPRALKYYLESDKRLPGQVTTYEDLAVVEFNQGHIAQALHFSLLAQNAGSKHRSNWVLGFVAARINGDLALALQIGDDYLRRFGDPDRIQPEIMALRANMSAGNPSAPSK